MIGLLLIVPTVNVFFEALRGGLGLYWKNIAGDPDTLTVAPIAAGTNRAFGVATASAIARFRFRVRALLISLIDLPFAVSEVAAVSLGARARHVFWRVALPNIKWGYRPRAPQLLRRAAQLRHTA